MDWISNRCRDQSPRRHPHLGLLTTTFVGLSISIKEGKNMLHQPTIEKLLSMRLSGMVEALKAQERDPASEELSFWERLGLIVDRQASWRQNLALQQRLKRAKLRANVCIE